MMAKKKDEKIDKKEDKKIDFKLLPNSLQRLYKELKKGD